MKPDEYRAPLQRSRNYERKDAKGGFILFQAFALLFVSLLLGVQSLGSPVWLLGQIFIAVSWLQWFIILHECGHGTLFRSRRLNDLAGRWAAALSFIPYLPWKVIHQQHHTWSGWQDLDPTTRTLTPRHRSKGILALTSLLWRCLLPVAGALYRFTIYWNPARWSLKVGERTSQRPFILSCLGTLLFWTVILSGLSLTAFPLDLRHWLLAIGLHLVIFEAIILSQHTHVPHSLAAGRKVQAYSAIEQGAFARSLKFPPWIARHILFHFNEHELHHMFPQVPCYHLARLEHRPRQARQAWPWYLSTRRMSGATFLYSNNNETGAQL